MASTQHPARRPLPLTLRLTALLAIVALVQLQWASMTRGGEIFASAMAQGMANYMTVIVVPAKVKEDDLATALERLLGQATERLEMVRSFALSPLPGD